MEKETDGDEFRDFVIGQSRAQKWGWSLLCLLPLFQLVRGILGWIRAPERMPVSEILFVCGLTVCLLVYIPTMLLASKGTWVIRSLEKELFLGPSKRGKTEEFILIDTVVEDQLAFHVYGKKFEATLAKRKIPPELKTLLEERAE